MTAGGQVYSTIINVIAARYPSSIHIETSRPSDVLVEPRVSGNNVELWWNGIGCNFFLTTDDSSYTASIKYVTYSVTNGTRTAVYSTRTGPNWDGDRYNIDERINVQEVQSALGIGNTRCVRINCPDGIPNDDSIYEYTITATVEFESNRQMTATKNVVVMQDNIPIVSSLQTYLYAAVADAWNTQFGTALSESRVYRIDLFALTGTMTFDTRLENLVTANSTASLLDYLPNLTGLVFDGNTNIVSLNNSVQNNDHN